jgi:FtsP/CotA-like multicopper oxidase with cupredoxin domain
MDVETSIHRQGILLPNVMDGVPFVTYPPIAPGQTFIYEFDLWQSGTYWDHSLTILQEQAMIAATDPTQNFPFTNAWHWILIGL